MTQPAAACEPQPIVSWRRVLLTRCRSIGSWTSCCSDSRRSPWRPRRRGSPANSTSLGSRALGDDVARLADADHPRRAAGQPDARSFLGAVVLLDLADTLNMTIGIGPAVTATAVVGGSIGFGVVFAPGHRAGIFGSLAAVGGGRSGPQGRPGDGIRRGPDVSSAVNRWPSGRRDVGISTSRRMPCSSPRRTAPRYHILGVGWEPASPSTPQATFQHSGPRQRWRWRTRHGTAVPRVASSPGAHGEDVDRTLHPADVPGVAISHAPGIPATVPCPRRTGHPGDCFTTDHRASPRRTTPAPDALQERGSEIDVHHQTTDRPSSEWHDCCPSHKPSRLRGRRP